MTPIRLKMQAFGPYQGAVEIAFSGLRGKLFLITGSTGGGKTTILDAICFALFCRATGGRISGGEVPESGVGWRGGGG